MKNTQQDNAYLQMSKNTVSAADQLKDGEYIRFYHTSGSGKRILFVGNSITMHGYKPEIGWYADHGMAASAPEKDYVHLVMSGARSVDPSAAFCLCQASKWERSYREGETVLPIYASARAFNADILILRIIENCPAADFSPEIFRAELKKLLKYLAPKPDAHIILTTGFWHHPGDAAITALGEAEGYPVIPLGDLGEQDEMKAIGLFAHDGVANHPGDLGMKHIAERILSAILPLI